MLPPILDVYVAAFCFAFFKMTLLKSIKSSQLNSGQKNKLSKLRKKSAINNGEKIFEEIFKKGNILPLLAGYLLRGGMKSRFT